MFKLCERQLHVFIEVGFRHDFVDNLVEVVVAQLLLPAQKSNNTSQILPTDEVVLVEIVDSESVLDLQGMNGQLLNQGCNFT